MPDERKQLTYEALHDAVRSAAAFRLHLRLGAVDGEGGKVFPPTYAGGVYAVEDRRVDGKVVRCALLDSVQSQANRMEELLLDAYLPTWRDLSPGEASEVKCDLPVVAVHVENHGWVNSLTAPHRIHDAILRDCEVKGRDGDGEGTAVRFRESSVGKEVVAARVHHATALYRYCPTALLFGTWDSTAGEGLDSAKVPRALVSEIIGVDITPGVRTGSRIDPLGIRAQSAKIYRLKADPKDWGAIVSDANGDNRVIGAESEDELNTKKSMKPSDINHGNVTPDMPRFAKKEIHDQNLGRLPDIVDSSPVELRYDLEAGDGRFSSHGAYRSEQQRIRFGAVKPGGVTMAYALHTWTLSLTQLRRLRFPVASAGSGDEATINDAARTVLAALGLYALALQQDGGYWLRSRCELLPAGAAPLELVGRNRGEFTLPDVESVRKIVDTAVEHASDIGIEWEAGLLELTPTEKLRELVRASDDLAPVIEDEEESVGADSAG